MSKKPTFLTIETCLIKRTLIQKVELCPSLVEYNKSFILITYYDGKEIRQYKTDTDFNETITKMFEKIKEALL